MSLEIAPFDRAHISLP